MWVLRGERKILAFRLGLGWIRFLKYSFLGIESLFSVDL